MKQRKLSARITFRVTPSGRRFLQKQAKYCKFPTLGDYLRSELFYEAPDYLNPK